MTHLTSRCFDANGTGPSDVDRFPSHDGMHMQSQPQEKIYVFNDLKGTLFKSGDEFRSQLRVHVISSCLTIRPCGFFFLEEANFALSYTCQGDWKF